jgi:capsular exopolysaccharide synthesis family protein
VRTNLYFSTRGESHKIIQVTSPNVSDGKSTVAANLAICIAQSGKKIIVVDGDFRKPRQHKIFGVTITSGLAAVCAGDAELQDVIRPTAVKGLSLLPCGPLPPNPSELLTSPRFKELIDLLRDQYDFVLIDTPPVLAVSDANAVAPRVDGVLFVIKVSKNGRPDAERAKQMLQTLRVNVLGVIVNRVGQGTRLGYEYESSPYGYHYGYGRQQGYYADEEPQANGENGSAPPAARTGAENQQRRHSRKRQTTLLQRITSWWTK